MTDAASAREAYRRALRRVGEVIEIRRGTGSTLLKASALCRVKGFSADELVGDIRPGVRKIIVLADDVTLDPPVQAGDRVVVRGKPMNVEAVDDSTRRIAGVLIAYEIRARGF